jgi:outer membrane protein OmpA-like peptidoglycan-associated protein
MATLHVAAAQAPPPDAGASAPILIESTPPVPWTPRLEAALQGLQRAARGSAITVQRDEHRIRIAAWEDAAFAPNSSELALPLRALLDEWTDSAPSAGWRVAVFGRTAPGGSAQANAQLALTRAQAVQRHLRLRGLTAVTTAGKEDAPPGPGRRGVELLLELTE